MPSLVFSLVEHFSNEPFYFLDEGTDIEHELFRPLVIQRNTVAGPVKVIVEGQNRVKINKQRSTREYMSGLQDDSESEDEETKKAETLSVAVEYIIPEIIRGAEKAIGCVLALPPRRQKTGCYVTVKMLCKDMGGAMHEQVESVKEIPENEISTPSECLLSYTKVITREYSVKALKRSAYQLKRGNKVKSKFIMGSAVTKIKDTEEQIIKYVSGNVQTKLVEITRSCMKLLDEFQRMIETTENTGNTWGKMKQQQTSLSRQMPATTSAGPSAGIRFPPEVQAKFLQMIHHISKAYVNNGYTGITPVKRVTAAMEKIIHSQNSQDFRCYQEFLECIEKCDQRVEITMSASEGITSGTNQGLGEMTHLPVELRVNFEELWAFIVALNVVAEGSADEKKKKQNLSQLGHVKNIVDDLRANFEQMEFRNKTAGRIVDDISEYH